MKCTKCGAELNERGQFCMMCGTKVEQKKVCKNCGEELDPRAKFCFICGTAVEETESPELSRDKDSADVIKNDRDALSDVDFSVPSSHDDNDPFGNEPESPSTFGTDNPPPEPTVLSIAGDLEYEGRSDLVNVIIADGVTKIGWGAFEDCKNLESITLPDSLIEIGYFAFSDCKKLKSINFPKSLTRIGDNTFLGCDSLKGITIPDSVDVIKFDFTVPLSDDDNDPFGNEPGSPSTFGEDNSPSDPTMLSSAGNLEYVGRSDLVNVIIADGVMMIGTGAFADCKNLESITLPDSLTEIGDGAFNGCEKLESITLPDSLIEIGDFAFQNCKKLKSINFPKSLTSIWDTTFVGCDSLEGITIPDSVEVLKLDFTVPSFDDDAPFGNEPESPSTFGADNSPYDPTVLNSAGKEEYKGRSNLVNVIIAQSEITAPALGGVYRSFGQSTVDSALNSQGFTVTKKDGAGLDLAFKKVEVETQCNGIYHHDASPLKEKPMTKYTLNLIADGVSIAVNKCADMSAYTLDSRYGFIYSKGNRVYRWVGNNETEIVLSRYTRNGFEFPEVVSLVVLRDYLLITEIGWQCTASGIDREFGYTFYTSSYYGACPVIHVYSFTQGKEIKEINGVGAYPQYNLNEQNQYVVKLIHYKKDQPSYQAFTNLTLTNLDTAFDWMKANMGSQKVEYTFDK